MESDSRGEAITKDVKWKVRRMRLFGLMDALRYSQIFFIALSGRYGPIDE